MTGHEDEHIRRRLRRAAEELMLRHGQEAAPSRVRGRRHVARWVAVGVPAVALLVAIGLLAVQFVGSERPGSLFDPSVVATSPDELGPDPSPTESPSQPADPDPTASTQESRGPEPIGTPSPAVSPPVVGGPACSPVASTDAPEDIHVTVEASSDEVARDGEITFTVRMKNTGLQPVSNEHSSQEYDLVVTDHFGFVWVWSHDRAFTQPLIADTYQPGEEREGVEAWDARANCAGARMGQLPPGGYRVFGVWLTSGGSEGWWSDPITIRIR